MQEPTQEQLRALAAYPADQKIVMINLLSYKKQVAGGAETGEEAYERYMQKAAPFVAKVGGRLLWKGSITQVVIGDNAFKPDSILLIEYPSVNSFLQMISDPEFQAVNKDRALALEYGGILAGTPEFSAWDG